MSSLWNREMRTMLNSLWQFRLFDQDPLRKHVPREIFAEGWDLYNNLAEKTIQWEPTSKTSRNSNSISSKGGLYSIESSITNEAKLANLARRLEALETKEPSPVSQVSPNQFSTPGCTYCPWIMCLRSVLYFRLSNNILNRWMQPFQGRIITLTHQCTILAGEITQISHGAKITMTTHG